MADNIQGSSQESLPLSQETFELLWQDIICMPPTIEETAMDNPLTREANSYLASLTPTELAQQSIMVIPKVEEVLPPRDIPYTPSSLPASTNWNGPYNFNVSFGPQEKNTKAITWAYSESRDKLYVGKDVSCPINFSADPSVFKNATIRAMALYSSPQHAAEIVHRCVNHSKKEMAAHLVEAEHLVRCESDMASYQTDSVTARHSVVVPFEVPPAGQHYSTYIYKFTCFGSCTGGPNRRPIMVIFSLEVGGQVVGRRKIDVKICACPGRDIKADEVHMPHEGKKVSKQKKRDHESSFPFGAEFAKLLELPAAKKLKYSHKTDQAYIIKTNDKKEYEFLERMKRIFRMCKLIQHLSPELRASLNEHARSFSSGESSN